MLDRQPGSVWSVLGIEDGLVVILAGPFGAARGAPEYLVAPLYPRSHPRFVWTSEDVRLEPDETGLRDVHFAALWNVRPVLEVDLVFQSTRLTHDATVLVRDAYWASLNEQPLGKHPRLGKRVRSNTDPAAQFQRAELKRWQPLSGRALVGEGQLRATWSSMIGHVWSMTLHDLQALRVEMEESEQLLPSIVLDSAGAGRAAFHTTIACASGAVLQEGPTLFYQALTPRMWRGSVLRFRVDLSEAHGNMPGSRDELTAIGAAA